MTTRLAERQLAIVHWEELRAGGESGLMVEQNLRQMLFGEGKAAGDAYLRLENPVVAQGNLFQCAPAVVSVIAAAVVDESVPAKNLAMVLDLLGRIVGGEADPSEVDAGNGDLSTQCQAEGLRAFWSLTKIALSSDPFGAHEVAADVLAVLDEPRSQLLLSEDG